MLMRCIVVALALMAHLASAPASRATDDNPDIPGEELRKLLSGNTVWVMRQDFSRGDEYHLPDGRVFGFNGVETIENGCWDIVGNEVCYYYKDDYAKGQAHCWTFKRTGPNRFNLVATHSRFRGFGEMQPGNPRNLSDNGKKWECKRLISNSNSSPRFVAR